MSSSCNDGDTKDSKLINPKELKWILDQTGTDPHAFKADYVGKKQSDNKNYWYIVGLSVVAVVAIVSPLDGPLGDVAAIGALGGALSQ